MEEVREIQVAQDCEGVKKGYRCHEERGFILAVRDAVKSSQDEDNAALREHLSQMDTSIQKMAESMNSFAVTAARSELRHEKNEAMFLRFVQIQDSVLKRLEELEVNTAVAAEKVKPFGWVADKIGTVIVTFIVTGGLTLIMIKGGLP